MAAEKQRAQRASVYAVTSGKGGVGKTNIVLNLALALTDAGRKVLVVDADLGLGNLDVLLGIQHTYTMGDILGQRCSLQEALVEGPKGIKLLAAESGVEELTRLNTGQKMHVFSLFHRLCDQVDTILIDTASGISSNVLFFSSFADQILLMATPEPTSITDAYATMKVLSLMPGEQDFRLMINQVESERQGREVFRTLCRAAEHFLETQSVDAAALDAMIDEVFRRTLGRSPTVGELKPLQSFLTEEGVESTDAWASVFQALFASVDFRYID